jgi:hypothetical protein
MASDLTRELQDQFLKAVRESQETVIDAIKAWIGTVQSVVPKMPPVQVPGAGQLPKPEEVVASAYDFAEQLLAGQRKFAEDIMKATSPLLPGADSTPKPKATKSTPKDAATE